MFMNMRYRKILALLLVMLTMGVAEAQETQVKIKGSVFGGGNEAAVKKTTMVNIGGGRVEGNVYGGGNVGNVGTINKDDINNYIWSDDTGICTVNIVGGAVGPESSEISSDKNHGNVFGAGKGAANSFWCEKGMVYRTSVSISNAKVKGTVYGGGEVGRVENNSSVTIDTGAEITGNVFGAGAGVATHGYSALVRGNSTVLVQGNAQVGHSVYGGGEIASVGRFRVVNSLPKEPLSGGTCTVTIQGTAQVGIGGSGDIYGACKGVDPDFEHAAGHWMNDNQSHDFDSEAEYLRSLKRWL